VAKSEAIMTAYHQPWTIAEAIDLLIRDPSLRIVAGATDIYPEAVSGSVWGKARLTEPLLDLSRIAHLRGIVDDGAWWSIGATTTWTDIIEADLPPLFDGLKVAAREIGGVQIQNRGTIGGNVCTASPAGDSIPCLLALDAKVELMGEDGIRIVPLQEFITGRRTLARKPNEIVKGLRIPEAKGRGHFLKLGARQYLVISIAMVAGTFEVDQHFGTVKSARIAVGACSPVAQRLPQLEARMVDRPLGDVLPLASDLAHLTPIDDVRATGAYRQAAALQLVNDLIAKAAEGARA
jgi:CO/xanthine dehydrogenase FAD-binding subunit